MRKLTFGIGFGLGYLLGTKDGRMRYEQIMRSVRDVKDNPAVQETAGVVQAQAIDLLTIAKDRVSDKFAGTKVGAKAGRGDDSSGYGAGSNGTVR